MGNGVTGGIELDPGSLDGWNGELGVQFFLGAWSMGNGVTGVV
jgi:hypothetical protein